MPSPQSNMDSPAGPSRSPPGHSQHTTGNSTASSPCSRTHAFKRKRSGCLNCRLRKKRCDEQKPICATCVRLGLQCMGYESRRPEWMSEKETVKQVTEKMKRAVAVTRVRRPSTTSRHSSPLSTRYDTPAAAQDAGNDKRLKKESQVEPIAVRGISQGYTEMMWDPLAFWEPLAGIADEASDNGEIGQAQGLTTDRHHPTVTVNDTSTPDHSSAKPTGVIYSTPCLAPIQAEPAYIPSSTSIAGDGGTSITSADSPFTFDNELLSFLGLPISTQAEQGSSAMGYHQNSSSSFIPTLPVTPATLTSPFASISIPTDNPTDMRYLHHYLTVVMPLQWRFDNQALSDLLTPLACQQHDILLPLSALAALHMAAGRRSRQIAPYLTSTNLTGHSQEFQNWSMSNPDMVFARSAIHKTHQRMRRVPLGKFDSTDSIVAALSIASFHLFDGGNGKGWEESVNLCRRCLATVSWEAYNGQSKSGTKPNPSAVMTRLGHFMVPLIWTDVLTTVTENKASEFLPLYRQLLLDDLSDGFTRKLLRDNVMGCDSTTRLCLAETVALSEWKAKAIRMGRLSHRELIDRANAIERLLAERRWRERHLFDSNDPATVQRRLMSDVFYHGVKVLLATVVDGCFPSAPDVASSVQDTADSLYKLDESGTTGADRALVMPIVIAGCHAEHPALQQTFRNRFLSLGLDGAEFGNTRNALRLMEEVWRRRTAVADREVEIVWRTVMFELEEEGLLLI